MKGKEELSISALQQGSVQLPLSMLEHLRDMALVCNSENFDIIYANKKFLEQFRMWSADFLQLIREPSREHFCEKIGALGKDVSSITMKTDMFRDGECYELTVECLEGQKGMLFIQLISCNEDGWIFHSGELENIFNDVQGQLEFGTWIYDLSIGKPQWSDGMFRLLELEKSVSNFEVSDEFYFSFVAPEDRPLLREKMNQFLINKEDVEHTYSVITAKGKRKIILTKVSILNHGKNGIERALGINKDITQRTLLTDQLKTSNEELSKKEQIFSFGTWEYDFNTRQLLWSDGMYWLYGYDPFIHRSHIPRDMEMLRKHISNEEMDKLNEIYTGFTKNDVASSTCDYTIKTTDGHQRKLESVMKIVRDETGQALKILGNTRDITEKDLLVHELLRYQEMIREKEEFLGQGSYEFEIKTGVSSLSDGLLRLYGYQDPSAVPELGLRDIFNRHFSEEEKNKILSSFKKLVETGGENVLEIAANVNGVKRIFEVYAKVYPDQKGGFEKIIGTTRDITAIKKLYNELLVFKEELIEREIMLKHGTWEMDLESRKVSMSDGLYDLLGLQHGHAPVEISYFLHNFMPDGEGEKINGMLTEVLGSGVAYVDDIRFNTLSGEILYLEFFSRLIRDQDGNPERVVGIARDATRLQSYKQELKDQVLRADGVNQQLSNAKKDLEVKLAELQKVNNELRLYKQTMLDKDEFLNQGTSEWDVLANKFEHSRGMYRLFGYYSKEEMKEWDSTGNNFAIHFNEEETRRSDEDWMKILAEADTYLREMEIRTHDGIMRKLETFGKVFRNEQGNAYKVIGTTRDITQLKEYEQELEVKIDELNRSNKDLEEFAYIASHDLHEPLRKLSTFGQRLMASAREELTPVNIDYVGRMLKATDTMRTLIDNLLEFSRVTRGSATFVKVNLSKIIEEVITEQELRIEETGAKITVGKMPELEVVSPQIKQLFNNLLNNALKFIREGVTPQIQFACRKATNEERIRFRLRQGREHYCISLTDNGIGFEKMYSDKIFQIFQRLHGKSEYTGSGIGLAICRKIAENHKGTIYAESEPGKGSSFTVILPNMP